jgi:hypothetical protein
MIRKPSSSDALSRSILTTLRIQNSLKNMNDPAVVFDIAKTMRDVELLANTLLPEFLTSAICPNSNVESLKRLHLAPHQLRVMFKYLSKF